MKQPFIAESEFPLLTREMCELVRRDPSLKKNNLSEQERMALFRKAIRGIRRKAKAGDELERATKLLNSKDAWLIAEMVRRVHAAGKRFDPETQAVERFMLLREGRFPLDAGDLEVIKAQDTKFLNTGRDDGFLKRWKAARNAGPPSELSSEWLERLITEHWLGKNGVPALCALTDEEAVKALCAAYPTRARDDEKPERDSTGKRKRQRGKITWWAYNHARSSLGLPPVVG